MGVFFYKQKVQDYDTGALSCGARDNARAVTGCTGVQSLGHTNRERRLHLSRQSPSHFEVTAAGWVAVARSARFWSMFASIMPTCCSARNAMGCDASEPSAACRRRVVGEKWARRREAGKGALGRVRTSTDASLKQKSLATPPGSGLCSFGLASSES